MSAPIGSRVRELRQKLNLNQEELAERARRYAEERAIKTETISRIENGKNEPAVWMLSALAQALGTTTDYLLALTDDPGAEAAVGLPVPAPGLAGLVARLNDLAPNYRQGVAAVAESALALLSLALRERPATDARPSFAARNDVSNSQDDPGQHSEGFAWVWTHLTDAQQDQLLSELLEARDARRASANG